MEAGECQSRLLQEELKETKVMLKLAMDFIMKYTHQCPNPQEHTRECPYYEDSEIEGGEPHD